MRQNLANDEQFNQHLAKYYQQAIDNINSELEHELLNMKKGHFLNQEVVEATDVQHYQDKAKKIVEQANQMRKAGKQVTYADFSKAVNDQMRVYNATMRINRLEMLKSQIGLEMVQSGIDVDKALHDKLSQDYIDEVKRQAGIMGVTAKPSMWTDSKVAKVIMGQTESANFSQRLWANQAALKAQLDQVISTGIIQGQNPREMATKLKANVAKTVANYRYVTERLARTESARVQHRAQIDSLIANDYRFCKWHAEPGHCKVCGEIASNDPDGNGRGIYEVDDVPNIPVHPNCRCSISAYWVNGQDNSYRGKHKKHVTKSSTGNSTKTNSKKLTDDELLDKYFNESLVKKFGREDSINTAKILDKAPEHIKKVWAKYSDKLNLKSYTQTGDSYYSSLSKGVVTNKQDMNLQADPKYYQKKYDVFFHEFGHLIDNVSGTVIPHKYPNPNKPDMKFKPAYNSSDLLQEALEEDWKNLYDKKYQEIIDNLEFSQFRDNKAEIKGQPGHWIKVKKDKTPTVSALKSFKIDAQAQTIADIKEATKNMSSQDYGDLSDVLSGCYGGYPLGVGHSASYWKYNKKVGKSPRMTEFFAEATSASINNPNSAKLLAEYFPKTWKGYNDIMKELGNQ